MLLLSALFMHTEFHTPVALPLWGNAVCPHPGRELCLGRDCRVTPGGLILFSLTIQNVLLLLLSWT